MVPVRAAIFIIALGSLSAFLKPAISAAQSNDAPVTQVAQAQLPALPPALLEQLQKSGTLPPDSPPPKPAELPTPVERPVTGNPAILPTGLELDYSRRAGSSLRLFGRNVFSQTSNVAGLNGEISDSYILGYGDEIIVTIRGQVSRSSQLRVDRNGQITLPDLPPISAVGRSYGDLRAEIEAAVARSFINSTVYVSLGEVRQISILLTGQVRQPGIERINGLSTVLQAIGGQLQQNSGIRNITITHDGKQRSIDLYNLLLTSSSDAGLSLADGDQVFVPELGSTFAVAGEVARPAIFEIPRSGITVKEAIALAGGLTRPSGNRLLRLTFDSLGRDRTTEILNPAESLRLLPTDILIVQRSENIQLDQVHLDGDVREAGVRALKSVPTLRDLLGGLDQLNIDPYLPFGIVYTVDQTNLSLRIDDYNLGDVLAGRANRPLRPGETVIVLSRSDIAFLGSADVQAILTHRPLPIPSVRRVETTAQVRETTATIAASQNAGVTTGAVVPSAEVQPASSCNALNALSAVAANDLGGRFANAIRGTVTAGENVVENILPCPAIMEKYPDILPYLLEHAITVEGEIRLPGIYPITAETHLDSVVQVARGLTRSADLRDIEISHFVVDTAVEQSKIERQHLNLRESDFSQISLNPGDTVRFNALTNDRENGPALLSGEFQHPGVYDLTRGDRLSTIIARAGGLTNQAYPYGAVLTRESVKAAETLAKQRTVRDLQASLGKALQNAAIQGQTSTTAATSGVADALTAIASTPAVGRVVVEADPTLLAARPDLDILLEPGDTIYMPKRPNYVTISGDVLNPSTQQFTDGASVAEYLHRAGDTLSTADTSRIFVVLPNGQAETTHTSFWNFSRVSIPPGSTIVVPRDLSPDFLLLAGTYGSALSQVAISLATLAVIAK